MSIECNNFAPAPWNDQRCNNCGLWLTAHPPEQCGAVNYGHKVKRVCTRPRGHVTMWHGDDKYLWAAKSEERQDICGHIRAEGKIICTRPKKHYNGTVPQHHGGEGVFWSKEEGAYPDVQIKTLTTDEYLREDVVPPNPLRDKMMSQKTEIRRLNAALARLSNLARGRLERNQALNRLHSKLLGENITLTQERDSYKKMLEEANQKLSESGYFIGLGEHNE